MRPAALALLAALTTSLPARGGAESAGKSLAIAAAANLKGTLEEVIAAFKEKNPGVDARANFGASGTFFAQIQNGAPFDLFLAADAQFPARVAAAGLALGRAAPYAYGKLVIWVPSSTAVDLEKDGLGALRDASVIKVAIGNPAVAPYGVAAEEALKAAGLYDAVKGKLVLGENINQAAQFAQTGNAQAALLPLSLALVPPLSRQGRYAVVPASSYQRIEQAAVVLKSSREPELAKAFLAHLLGPQGRAILERSGYGLPAAE